MSIFLSVALVIIAASLFGFLARLAHQPLIIGYIFAGFILSILGVLGEERPLLEGMSAFGVTFLLFIVGLEMKIKELPTVGKVALMTGLGQIIFTSIIGFFIGLALGFSTIASLYIAVALTFSSTIIIVQLLSEKRDLNSLYGKISVGFLLVQDFVAILILVLLSGFQYGTPTPFSAGVVIVKGAGLVLGVWLVSRFLLSKLFDRLANQSELLFMGAIAWALGLGAFVSSPLIGFSTEIGGFLAGLALANSSEHLQIESRVRPLRDFFITIFFFLLGAKMIAGITPSLLVPALVFSVFVLIGNPLVVMGVMGVMGYKRRTSFLASVTVAQISEFSLILVAMGERLGHITSSVVGLVSVVGVVTMTASTYLILNSQKLFFLLRGPLGIFERKRTRESAFEPEEKLAGHIVMIGANRTGSTLLPVLKSRAEELLVVDFNPDVVSKLTTEGIHAMYGDISDNDSLEFLNLPQARLVISTVSDATDNLLLLNKIRGLVKRPLAIFVASTPSDAIKLYEAGADYVMVPRVVSGEHLAMVLQHHGLDRHFFKELRDSQFERLVKDRF